MRIAIYSDYGAATLSVKQLLHSLQALLPSWSVFPVKSDFVVKNQFSGCDLFCVGGGFSRGVVNSMTDVGLTNLRSYVRSGGKYLGICSGAYLASRLTQFAVGSPLEVIDAGYLNFFEGNTADCNDLRTPAIIRCPFGDGQALLSGIHFEFDPFCLAELEKDPYFIKIFSYLEAGDSQRRQFCKAVLEDFLG
ncbi:unnamed protein product [Schistocephalus solidus]|uniref:BPL_N domain-containing protein n=1 Tax=Schistocephalus solidus TaxID=70667 RepID=A0A183TA59_SCHSO|nr:unnamed protein product [Schistocephalus solidus]